MVSDFFLSNQNIALMFISLVERQLPFRPLRHPYIYRQAYL